MNKCHFLGKLTSDPDLNEENGECVVTFELECEEFRKDSNGEKVRNVTYLSFEAWSSAALAIEKYAEEGTLMAVESVARNEEGLDEDDIPLTYFRVTNFKILGL